MQHVDRIRIQHSLIIGLLFLTGIWSVKLIEWAFHLDLAFLGILPLHAKGLAGILTAPLIHADFGHAGANSIPIFVSAALIWYFYRPVAWQVFSLIWIITGLGVWGFARESYHIGASGLVYGYISFLFFSGILRRNLQLMAISMLMVFLYGGLIWGIFPEFFPERNISWESHLMGGLAGLIIAFVYKKYSVPRKMYSWEIEPEEDEDDEQPWNNTHIN
jgi:membrane associated rhomboid family serine protease